MDDPTTSVHDALGVASTAATRSSAQEPDLAVARAHLRRWGWQVSEDSSALRELARALAALDDADVDVDEPHLDVYAGAAAELGRADVAAVPMSSQADAVRFVVLGTVLFDPVLLFLRRLAQQEASALRFESQPASGLVRPPAADRTAAGT